jgi:hypothetical protein
MQLTKEEAQLVLRLLELWDSAWEHARHQQCDCGICETTERAGEHEASTFDSLKKKAEAV